MRLLLINPKSPESFWNFHWAVSEVLGGKRAVNPPLGLATLAALCPPHWQVRIVDENVEPLPLAPEADLIGIGGMGVQFPRQRELIEYYRGLGHFVAAGGSFASLCPERYAGLADAVICGEAEHIWPRFCADFEAGAAQALYREDGVINLADSPVPRFDLLRLELYTTATMQFSRGCPYLCEFCDIIVMFGRKPRQKPLEQVGRELDALRARGVRKIFFVDDNLIGHRAMAKQLLRFLEDYQRRHDYAFSFGTETSLNLAEDEELMLLMRAAGFRWTFIGIESPDEASLREMRKVQNMRADALESVQRIHGHGIEVLAGFIIGFDNDTVSTFDRQFQFIARSGIQTAMIGLLHAMPRTPLYERLRKAGRLRETDSGGDNTKLDTNVEPLNMSRDELIDGYRGLHRRLLADRAIARRIRSKCRSLGRPAGGMEYRAATGLAILARLLWRGILPGGPARHWHFLRTLPWRRPWQFPFVIGDWIVGLSMQDYARRHFGATARTDTQAGGERLARLARTLRRLRAGQVSVIPGAPEQSALVLDLRLHAMPGRALRRIGADLGALLRETPARLTLTIDQVSGPDLLRMRRLLRRLRRFADRISIETASLHAPMLLQAWPFQLRLRASALGA
jgi:radical SAM superfamily enzyme YgiQ (UPF0313 family)